MPSVLIPSPSFLSLFLPIARATLRPVKLSEPAVRRIPILARLPSSSSAILPPALLPISNVLDSIWNGLLSPTEIWDGLLNAVPKKKTSHMKKRHRQMAGKALKDVTALNKCSACGKPKRAHVLCPYCVKSIQQWIATGFKSKSELKVEAERMHELYNEELRIQGKPPIERPKEDDNKL